jgi:hypothetical protein
MAISVKYFPRIFTLIAILCASSCSSQFNSGKSGDVAGAQLTALQKKQQIAKLSPYLQGEWICSGSTGNFLGCPGETLTFNSTLDQLIIENSWNNQCLMATDYQVTIGTEDSEGMTDFTIHASGPGQLDPRTNTDACKDLIAKYSKPLDENFSFTHSSDWSQITVGDNVFTKIPAPQPSVSPIPSPAPSPSSSIQLSNS